MEILVFATIDLKQPVNYKQLFNDIRQYLAIYEYDVSNLEIFYEYVYQKEDGEVFESDMVKRIKLFITSNSFKIKNAISLMLKIVSKFSRISKRYFIGVRIIFDDITQVLDFSKKILSKMKKLNITMRISDTTIELISFNNNDIKKIIKFLEKELNNINHKTCIF